MMSSYVGGRIVNCFSTRVLYRITLATGKYAVKQMPVIGADECYVRRTYIHIASISMRSPVQCDGSSKSFLSLKATGYALSQEEPRTASNFRREVVSRVL